MYDKFNLFIDFHFEKLLDICFLLDIEKGNLLSRVAWDTKEPLISFIETPIMSFNQYFCYIGGLFGMWFGISLKKLYHIIQIWFQNHFKWRQIFSFLRNVLIIDV